MPPRPASASAPRPTRPDLASGRVVVYACSGGSDAGELADRTARALSQSGLGEMSCLAGIGGKIPAMLKRAAVADRILVIDGCPLNCARQTLTKAGFSGVLHLELHRLGCRKGDCSPTPERIEVLVRAAADLIQAPPPPNLGIS